MIADAAAIDAAGVDLLTALVRRFGQARLQVQGSSMLPAIRPADVLVIECADMTSIVPGDVVATRAEGRLLAHRVVAVRADRDGVIRLVTRGDTLTADDAASGHDRFVGRVSGVLRAGVWRPVAPARRGAIAAARLMMSARVALASLVTVGRRTAVR